MPPWSARRGSRPPISCRPSTFATTTTTSSSPRRLYPRCAGQSLSPVYEFPVTIEDEEKPRLGDRFEAESAVVSKIAAHHGLVVILIHPDILGHKLAFERQLIARWKDRAWMPDLDQFGVWWVARDKADFDLVEGPNGWSLSVDAPSALHNVTVLLPKGAAASQIHVDGVLGHAFVPLNLAAK